MTNLSKILAVFLLSIAFECLALTTAVAQNSATGGVYLANRNQVARSRNFYESSPHWENIQGDLPIPFDDRGGIIEFVLDPFDPINRAWIALGSPDSWSAGSVWRTNNLDASPPIWTEVLSEADIISALGGNSAWVKRIQASPLQPGLVYIAVAVSLGGLEKKIHIGKSLDYGTSWTWSDSLGAVGDRATGFALSGQDANRLWVGVGVGKSRILFSDDGGTTFSELASFKVWWNPYDIFVPAIHNPDDQLMFAIVDSASSVELYRSLDGGHSWKSVTRAGAPPAQLNRMIGIVSPQPGNFFYISSKCGGPWKLLVSTDYGSTWEQRFLTSKWMSAVWSNQLAAGQFITARAQSSLSNLEPVVLFSADVGYTWEDKTGDWYSVMGLPYSGAPGSCGGTASVTIVDANGIKKPEIIITSPKSGDKWLVEEQHDIKWEYYAVQDVRIEYSENAGKDWVEIESSWPASTGKYTWNIPNLTSSKCMIRISSVVDPNVYAESDRFTIKGWILARLVNGEYEIFQMDKHAWSFGNSEQNMWPESWWKQFDYTVYPYNTEPFVFTEKPINAKPKNFPDWPLFVQAFRKWQCYFNPPPGLVVYRPSALIFWVALKDGLLKGEWGGSCAGFAISSLAAFDDKEFFLQKFPQLGTFQELRNVNLDDISRMVVNQLWLHQYDKNRMKQFRLISSSPIVTLKKAQSLFLRDTNRHHYLVLWSNNKGLAVHAVVPYRIEKVSTKPDTFLIYIYDNNAPSDDQRKIWVYEEHDEWYWEYSEQKWKESWGMHLMGEAIDFLYTPLIPILPALIPGVSSQNSTKESERIAEEEHIVFLNSAETTITISDTSGNAIGFRDSVLFNQIQDAIPIVPITSKYQPPIGYMLPEAKYDIQIDSPDYFTIFDDSTIFNFRPTDSYSSETYSFTYATGKFSIENSDTRAKRFMLRSIIVDREEEKVFQIEKFVIQPGDSIHFREVDRKHFSIANHGTEKRYDIAIELASANGVSNFYHPDVPISANSSHIIAPNWHDLENQPIQIFIDESQDGSIDDTLTVENQTVSIEEPTKTSAEVPVNYFLAQNYPNPFNSSTTIDFGLPKSSKVRIEIFNLLGQRIATLIDELKPAGFYSIIFRTERLPSAVYIYKIQAGPFSAVKKMILVR